MRRIEPQERRLHPRREYRTRIVFEDEFGDGLFYVNSADISMGGIFLASDVPLRLGTLQIEDGRLGWRDIPPPAPDFFVRALAAVRAVDAAAIARACGEPQRIAERLHQARVDAVREALALAD